MQKKFFGRSITNILSILSSLAVIILALLQLFHVWDKAIYIYGPLMGINLLLMAAGNWKDNRKIAWFEIFVAILVVICAIGVIWTA